MTISSLPQGQLQRRVTFDNTFWLLSCLDSQSSSSSQSPTNHGTTTPLQGNGGICNHVTMSCNQPWCMIIMASWHPFGVTNWLTAKEFRTCTDHKLQRRWSFCLNTSLKVMVSWQKPTKLKVIIRNQEILFIKESCTTWNMWYLPYQLVTGIFSINSIWRIGNIRRYVQGRTPKRESHENPLFHDVLYNEL